MSKNIVVAGTGYVGLVTAVCLSEVGHSVTCVDSNEDKVKTLKQNICPIYEPQLEDLMIKNKDRLNYTTDYQSAYKNADVIFVAVGTPEQEDGSANLSYVHAVARQIAVTVENDCVVVVKSTVPIGTNDDIEQVLINNLKNNVKVTVASNPEFLAQGSAVKDTLHAKRIVIGTEDSETEKIMVEVYTPFNIPFVLTNRRSAEMIKYAANDFLALKISYINEIANFCEMIGANIDDVVKGMSYDPRIGDKFLQAGIGYGGSCFPKDTKALYHLASKEYGYELSTVKAAIDVNTRQKTKLFFEAKKHFTSFVGIEVAVLGLTFKPNTDDLRESPSLENVKMLLKSGAKVTVYDPVGMDNFKKVFPDITYVNTPQEALNGKDCAFVLTEWDEIKKLTPNDFKSLKNPIVFDGRNCYDPKVMSNADILYISIGR